MTKPTHLVVGAGKMGGALISGWLASGSVSAKKLIILDPKPGDDAKAAIQSGAKHIKKANKTMEAVDYVLLAIKPQSFGTLAPDIEKHLAKNTVIISILAGTSLMTLQDAFPERKIIRAMPNTPASIGQGITAYTKGSKMEDNQIKMIEALLSATGDVHHVANEHLIDVVTAVSGSGPAYIFHMVEALEAAALHIGLPAELAPAFARQTVIGAASLLAQTETSATELRQNVTSPNGTTAAALDVLMDINGLPSLMRETVQAALKRAKELAEN